MARKKTTTASQEETRQKTFLGLAAAGPNGALIAVAVVLESILIAWFASSTGGRERAVAGAAMVVVLVVVVVAVVLIEYLRARRGDALPAVGPEMHGLDKPSVPTTAIVQVQAGLQAKADVGAPSAEAIRSEPIVAADGSYFINPPSKHWSIRRTTLDEELKLKLGMVDVPAHQKFEPSSMLVLEFGRGIEFEPRPDKTSINGSRVPVLLTQSVCRELRITSFPRRQPPFFSERSLYDNFVSLIAASITSQAASMTSLSCGTLPKTNRDMVQAQIVQEFENVLIDDREIAKLRIDIRFTAIRGPLFDYAVGIVNFRDGTAADELAVQMDIEVGKLFESFSIAAADDPEGEARALNERANKGYIASLASAGSEIFGQAFYVAMNRIQEIDYGSAQGMARTISVLRPLHVFAKMIEYKDIPDLTSLWQAMDAAERGDTGPLRNLLDDEKSGLKADAAALPSETDQPAPSQP